MTTGHLQPAPPPTKLERFLRENHIKPAELARELGCARQHLVRIRLGHTKRPRLYMKLAITAVCARLSHREVTVEDLFD